MAKNLKELRQELKSFAKKVKDFKYTDSALITFLLTGAIGKVRQLICFQMEIRLKHRQKR